MRRPVAIAFALAALVAVLPAHARAASHDDTAWLQARLDAGGTLFLPRPGGACYATRGLWVTRDDTQITSDGACHTALGPGEARLTDAPQPTVASAVFFVSHDSIFRSQPVRVRITGLQIGVPRAADVAGIAVFGHETTIDSVTVDGAPTNDVAVGSATAGATERVTISNSTLRGGRRNVLTAVATIGLRIEHDVLAGGAGNGLVLRAGARGLPVLDADASGNTISGNAGAGVLLDLEPPDGLPVLADGIRLAQNTVVGNARHAPARLRAGISSAAASATAAASSRSRKTSSAATRAPRCSSATCASESRRPATRSPEASRAPVVRRPSGPRSDGRPPRRSLRQREPTTPRGCRRASTPAQASSCRSCRTAAVTRRADSGSRTTT